MKKSVILFRDTLHEEEELLVCKKYFDTYRNRSDLYDSFVIPRYSYLPYPKELEYDLNKQSCKLINSYNQHRYVADIKEWYEDLKHLTPKTWRAGEVPFNENGPFVLKGETNSRKQLWETSMFASDRKSMIDVQLRLQDDTLIGHQDIYVRKYIPLKSYGINPITKVPIAHEFRLFFYKNKELARGYYWATSCHLFNDIPDGSDIPQDFLDEVVEIVSEHIDFWVVDIAQTKENDWIVVELNDGAMAGISCIDPNTLYGNLKKYIEEQKETGE